MRKITKLFAILALFVLGAMNVGAQETVPLSTDIFFEWDGWGADAQKIGPAECALVLNQSTGQPYGDPSVNNYADLSLYSKLIVKATAGTPRFLFNRTKAEGQYSATEEESFLLEYPKNGWSDRYFTVTQEDDATVYTVDLKQMVKDKGFAHLHAIKGANWSDVTVISMDLVRQGKAQVVGWTDLITNGDMEGEEVISFYSKENAGAAEPSVITDGVGVDGSRGIQVHSAAGASQDWDAQFWINLPETLPEGTKYRGSFALRASMGATADTQAHADPSDYIHWAMIGSPTFTTEWDTYSFEGEISAEQAGPNSGGGLMHSIAFNLSKDKANDIDFFFDNVKFEVFKLGTMAEFSNDVILLDFGFDTNLPELVKATGKSRLLYAINCADVTVNGESVAIASVEGFEDGRFYIFLEEPVNDNDEVLVSFFNPNDLAYHLVYTSGPGGDVKNITDLEASYSPEVEDNDGYPWAFITPSIIKADPEDGSFNLPNSIKEFKVTFDKEVDCAALVAKLDNEKLAVSPATGFAEAITLTRTSTGDLKTGEYTIHITHIYPQMRLDDSIFGDTIYTINVGKVVIDPNDVPADLLPDYFSECPAATIPEGWFVMFGQEERPSGSSNGSGPRMMDFGAGGDFTKGLYFREGYAEYGSTPGYELKLEADKRYNISFMSAMWKDNGNKTRFEILTEAGDVAFVQVVDNKPNVNGSNGAVNGAASYTFKFYPETTGNYILRWTSSGSETGDGGWMEVILANPQVKYVPNVVGIEETQLLNNALANAKATRDANSDERYAGTAYNVLVSAIEKYDAEAPTYTAPSAYKNAAAALDAATQAVKDHRALCDAYDPLPQQAQDIIDANAEKKFAKTDTYTNLIKLVAKYATATTETVVDPETGEESEKVVLVIKQLTNDAELKAAVDELKYNINNANLIFTEGESKTADTGVKVLAERLRLGAEALKSLGVAESDPLVQAAYNTLTDDDELAERVKQRLTLELYGQLKDPNNNLFEETIDENTLESITASYDMTVFVKNPNIYKQTEDVNFTSENVPGWETPEGYNRPGLSWGWNASRGTNEIAEDCMFQTWGSSYRVEQTITDLPAGVYTVKIGFGERMNDDENNMVGSFIYAKTTDTPEGEDGLTADVPGIGQSFPYANTIIEDVLVTDGFLTIGGNGGASSHTFFNDVRLVLTAPAAGFDYEKAYTAGIETVTNKQADVKAIEIFSLDGRRLSKATKGVFIIRKHMSDGTIQTEKVIKK
ncbi:MAG: hypothetical protein IKW98_13740 [Prevotella sp.]|nr:hypothetical protein [Prevotella sp.]